MVNKILFINPKKVTFLKEKRNSRSLNNIKVNKEAKNPAIKISKDIFPSKIIQNKYIVRKTKIFFIIFNLPKKYIFLHFYSIKTVI